MTKKQKKVLESVTEKMLNMSEKEFNKMMKEKKGDIYHILNETGAIDIILKEMKQRKK